jgi:hypothetical protein
MTKPLDRSPQGKGAGPIFGRARFARISAVEGIRLSPEMEARFREFDHRNLPASERRKAIARAFTKAR